MGEPIIPAAVRSLEQARRMGAPIEPLSVTYPELDLDAAYAVQRVQVEHWAGDGDVVKGHKVGLTSAAMREQLGVDEPDYGHLMASMFHAEFEPIPAQRFLQPRIEPEVAFVLGGRLVGPGVTVADAIRVVEFVLPALEIIDSRIAGWRLTLADTVADNASSGGVVLGAHPTRLGDVELRSAGCMLTRNGLTVGMGIGGAVLGDPLLAVVWLANTLGARGVALEPGHVVLSGACTAAVPIGPGETFTASFAGMGSATAAFTTTDGGPCAG